ncbi:MAG: glycosyltransferase family 4 protein [Planctomycetota bacterium]
MRDIAMCSPAQQSPPIRVLHLITRMILGGAQENTLLTCEGLHDDPYWDVTLVTGPAVGPEGELMSRAYQHDIDTIVVPSLRRSINPWRDTAAFDRILRIIRHIRPTILHTHSSKAGILGRFAAQIARTPITIHTVHGLPFHRNLSHLSNAAFISGEWAGAHCSDAIICVADAMTEQALNAGVGSPDQYTTIHSGMEVEKFLAADHHRKDARKALGFEPDDIVIGKIARLFPLKGHKYLLEAAPKIIDRCPHVKLLFVGNGVLRETLETRARELRIRDRIVFAGLVDPSRIPHMIGAMDILVHASLREGLPRAIVQALLGGRPVVSYDVDGAPEVVIDDVTGHLVPPRSVQKLAEAVIGLVKNPEHARAMGREGQRRFTHQFRASTMVQKIQEVYRQQLAKTTGV